MDQYEDMEAAARRRDCQRCSRIMFQSLYQCKPDDQRQVARLMLWTYLETWFAKHDDHLRQAPLHLLISDDRRETPPDFPEDLDPADAEFENGLMEFRNGSLPSSNHTRRTMHFATAIRSAVLARQINAWLCTHSRDYAKWKMGQTFEGPTFLDDEPAAKEAETTWTLVDALMKEQPKPHSLSKEAAAYKRWQETSL